jgi:MFS family permease
MAMPRNLYRLDGLNFFIAAMQAGFGTFVTVYLVRNHWTVEAVGFALTISTVCSLISQVPAGALIDSIHDKRWAVRLGTVGVGAAFGTRAGQACGLSGPGAAGPGKFANRPRDRSHQLGIGRAHGILASGSVVTRIARISN